MASARANRTPKQREQFLDGLRDGKSVSHACIDAGIARRTVYDWRDADVAFAAAWDDAIDEGTDRMEDEAHRRAVQGTTKPVYQGGKQVGALQEYSDTLMIFLLKARRPEKFKDRVALGGDPANPVEHVHRIERVIVQDHANTDAKSADDPQNGSGRGKK